MPTLRSRAYAGVHAKLPEEAAELRDANADESLNEAADVFEVGSALISALGLDIATVAKAADGKRTVSGGFADRIWLEQ
jgi:predicted house-cleaning noncanonical NTP pyrophosphatase (MazG superfamily)